MNTWIKEGRRKRGMSQRDLGEKLGVTHVAISNWETGSSSLPDARRREIAKILDIDEMPDEFSRVTPANLIMWTEDVMRSSLSVEARAELALMGFDARSVNGWLEWFGTNDGIDQTTWSELVDSPYVRIASAARWHFLLTLSEPLDG